MQMVGRDAHTTGDLIPIKGAVRCYIKIFHIGGIVIHAIFHIAKDGVKRQEFLRRVLCLCDGLW